MQIKNQIRQNLLGRLLINYKRILSQKIQLRRYNDREAVCHIYQKRLNRELDLENPKRFTEKLQWLKLYYRRPVMTRIADKIAVREYLTDRGYGEYLVPVVGIYRSASEIDFSQLPEKCILKASHGSSMHLVKNGEIRHPFLWKMIMKSWLKMNIYVEGREWPYKNVRPGIICEEFMEAKTEHKLRDYKVFCFSGNPEFIQVDTDLLKDHRINFYDTEWKQLPITCQYPGTEEKIPKPVNYETMLEIAKNLSKDFPHVRVDFYEYDTQLRIGEMTFFDGSGFYNFHPDQYDFIFGEKLQLPEKKQSEQ